MKGRTFILAVICMFAALSTAFGEEAMNPLMKGSHLTLEESIEIALAKNPTLKGAQGAIKEAKYRRLGAVSDFLPQVDSQYSYTRLDKEPSFYYPPPINTTITMGTRDVYTWQSTVTQPVFTGGALINNYLLADLGVDTARVEFERTKLDLILNVKEAYYGVLTAEKGVEVAEQTVEQLESNLKMAQAFYDVGMTAKNDLLQVEVSKAIPDHGPKWAGGRPRRLQYAAAPRYR
jgi:outer membrane protein TolC